MFRTDIGERLGIGSEKKGRYPGEHVYDGIFSYWYRLSLFFINQCTYSLSAQLLSCLPDPRLPILSRMLPEASAEPFYGHCRRSSAGSAIRRRMQSPTLSYGPMPDPNPGSSISPILYKNPIQKRTTDTIDSHKSLFSHKCLSMEFDKKVPITGCFCPCLHDPPR